MKLHKKIVYFKNIRHGKEPCKYEASQPNGVNTDVYATIKLDPILKKKKKGAWAEKDKGHAWKVVIAGKDSGIVESNYPYASKYWAKRAKILDKKLKNK